MSRKEIEARYVIKKNNRCLDCGVLIDPKAKRCRDCANKAQIKPEDAHNHCANCGKRILNHNKLCLECHKKKVMRHPQNNHCTDCGKPIVPTATRCLKCAIQYQWDSGIRKPNPNYKGEKVGAWKGGVSHHNGYIGIYMPEHPRATRRNPYVEEHIFVWETINGKPLPKGWHVHHLNGIKDDNRPSNLAGMPSRKHFLVLAAKTKRIQELEALINGQAQLL